MRIRTNDGIEFTGADAAEVVEALRLDSWALTEDVTEFMRDCARRAEIQVGARISVESAERFLKSLQSAGLVKFLTEGGK